ncbi:acyl-phosphate glycerol 3-phosphate acyltransferase [Dehalococcoides mccartyi]|jgi:glycerol-3-phosphate acyltransferase PlsY|uniref:glycerol-3-phosphate 1-O-acyltransferase PlsY n=1 Tax=Dehalococcoides mccartyi TaxID=61435 RepID=UPI0004E07EF9|nr:glycerol-3-phosphate 1-O-acyltransferase PlsY [Dehalococcoides mccartyi]AII58347.1 membrane protein [Dehalococcoides mccartyi CG1]APH12922.1 acyl-phosphate glycerol 3-phosphate acyltransferase [Dehalococcoides mccartyi]
MLIVKLLLVVIVSYILGSIPFGYLVSHRGSKIDIRSFGSGRTGATNVLRTMGRKAALLVAALDVIKGASAVAFAGMVIGTEALAFGTNGMAILFAQVLAGLAAVAGHIWPVFLKFRGGRGVATFFGGMIALCPVAAIFGGEVLIIGAGLSGFASLGSITGVVGAYALLVPLTLISGFPTEYIIYAVIGSLLITIMHRDNIKRLLAGKERKLNEKAR